MDEGHATIRGSLVVWYFDRLGSSVSLAFMRDNNGMTQLKVYLRNYIELQLVGVPFTDPDIG